GPEHFENPMNLPPQKIRLFASQSHFTTCQKMPILLKTKTETAVGAVSKQRSFAFTSLFECWSLTAISQAGGFLLRLDGGSRDPIRCGFWASQPQDAGFDKIEESKRLAMKA